MLKIIILILALIVIMQPVTASDLLIYIRPGTLENQTEGFVLMYPLDGVCVATKPDECKLCMLCKVTCPSRAIEIEV